MHAHKDWKRYLFQRENPAAWTELLEKYTNSAENIDFLQKV